MPPSIYGRCRFQYVLATLAAMLFASASRGAPPEPITLKGHTGWVGGVAFSPDGQTIATASADNTVKLWDAVSGKNTATLKGHTDYVACVAFSSDKKTLVSGSFDRTAIVWDLESGKPRHTLKGHTGAVLSVAVQVKGDRIATGSVDASIRLWETDTGRGIANFPSHKLWVNSLAYSRDGALGASGSSDGTVMVADPRGKATIFKPKAAEVRSVAFSPDGKLLAAGTRYGIVKVWSVEKGEEVASLKGKHGAEVWAVAFAPDGKSLATADGDWNRPSDVVLWDTATWKEHARLKHTNEVLCLAFHPTKPVLAAGAWDKTVRVWDLTETPK